MVSRRVACFDGTVVGMVAGTNKRDRFIYKRCLLLLMATNAAKTLLPTKSGYRSGSNERLLANLIRDYQKHSDHELLRDESQAANWQAYMRENDGKANAYTAGLLELRRVAIGLLSDLNIELEMLNQPVGR